MAAIAMAWGFAGGGGADRVDPCLHWRPFLVAHQGLVYALAGFACRRGPTAADPGDLRLCYGGQSGAACSRESKLCGIIARTFQPDGPEKGGDWPDRASRLGLLSCADITALCRTRRAQLALSPSPAALAEPVERTNIAHLAGSDGARSVAGKWHSARFGLWWESALHHLPDFGDKGPGQASRAIGTGGQSARPN